MSNLKKTALAVLALSSGAVFAGTMGPVCSAVNVTVPCESTAWDLGGSALYFQPDVTSGSAGSKTISTGSGHTADFGRNPKWGWGFMIEGSYHFNTGNDLNLNWYHVGTNRSGGFNGSKVVDTNFAPGLIDSNTAALTSVTVNKTNASIDPKWDMVNLEFGQHVDFGENKSIRFHGGFEFARLTANNSLSLSGSTVTSGSTATPSFSNSVGSNPSYNGFGPRLGADMGYDWGNGLAIYAKGAAALLAGSAKYSTTFTNAGLSRSVTASGSSTVVVPELEGKLGAAYSYATAQGDLTFDAGWMWINYFNAVRSQGNDLLDSPHSGDFGLQGVYFGLKWLGNVA